MVPNACDSQTLITMSSQLYSDEVIGTFLICDVVSRAFVSASYVPYNAINRKQRERERMETLLLLDEPYYIVLVVRCVKSMRHVCTNDVLRVTRFAVIGY